MSYQPFLIANYATGIDRSVQPWLAADDAFIEIFDGYVYRGVTQKRDGYSGYANGDTIYTESRMVHTVVDEAYGTGDGTVGPFTHTAANIPLSRGSITITADTQTATDDGLGGFVTSPAGGSGSVDYTTGDMSITFNGVVAGATPITVTYDYYPGLPVMGIMNFYASNNDRILIVADTKYVNKYNPSTKRLEDISPASAYGGTYQDFWSWVNYPDASNNPRLLFSNRVNGDVIQQYDGSTVTDYAPTFAMGTTLNARQIFDIKDRLVLFQTIEGGTLFPRRIRISGTGANCDVFDNTAPGAGFIDIPDNTWYYGAASNRDDVIFFTEAATWILKYTGNDVVPFELKRMDGSRGSKAAFSVITYLNRTFAGSPRGLLISDGYKVDRMDNNIPEFSFNTVNSEYFESCFSGFLDEERDVYFLFPSTGERPALVDAGSSDQILAINFEEDNLSNYRIPLSCMGNFIISNNINWNDLLKFDTWDAMAEVYGNWNDFPFNKGSPIAIGGGHKGEVWKLNDTENEDNPLKVRDLTVVDSSTLRVVTDWNNYNIGDYISFDSVEGMTEVNGKQGAIKAISVDYTTFDIDIPTLGFSAYTEGGTAAKSIPFEALTKKFNPYVLQGLDKKIKCGWIYFYVSTASTSLVDNDGNPVPAYLFIDVFMNDYNDVSVPTFSYQVDCTPTTNEDKKWVKIWINQTAKFLQFRMRNNQAGADIKVQAMMPGLTPVGRLV